MIKSFFSFFLVVLLFLTSCGGEDLQVSKYELKGSDDILRIELDSLTSNQSFWLDYYYDEELDSGLLFSVDPTHNEIELYSLNRGKLIDKVVYDREGPEGIGTLIEIGVQGLDSVLIFPAFEDKFYQSRLSDGALKNTAYDKPDEYAAIRSLTTYFSAKAFTDQDYVYTRTLFGGNYLQMTNEELSSKPLMYRVNASTGEVEFSHFTFPDDYWANGKRQFQFSSVGGQDRFAFSFHSDHHIYFGTSFKEPLNKKEAKSKYLGEVFENLPEGDNRDARTAYYARAAHYGNLLYDQFRNVYYRFCFPQVEIKEGQDLKQLTLFPEKFSVMILNTEFEVIGETMIGGERQYATSNVFVGPKGLYISVNHPDSELNQEDSFGFQLFTLQEKAD